VIALGAAARARRRQREIERPFDCCPDPHCHTTTVAGGA
jgi:hypothetical protein